MYSEERQNAILEYLKEHGRASVTELAEKIYASEATVRRDLSEMSERGLVNRTHGGALFRDDGNETPVLLRQTENPAGKERVAVIAVRCLPNFQTVFMDNSSTCFILAKHMDLRFKTVITNSLHLARLLETAEKTNVILTGGEVRKESYSLQGATALSALQTMHADLMLCSCAAITGDGCFEYTSETTLLKRTAFENCDKRILLADKNKFLCSATFLTKKISDFDVLVTDAPSEFTEKYAEVVTVVRK